MSASLLDKEDLLVYKDLTEEQLKDLKDKHIHIYRFMYKVYIEGNIRCMNLMKDWEFEHSEVVDEVESYSARASGSTVVRTTSTYKYEKGLEIKEDFQHLKRIIVKENCGLDNLFFFQGPFKREMVAILLRFKKKLVPDGIPVQLCKKVISRMRAHCYRPESMAAKRAIDRAEVASGKKIKREVI